MTNNDNNFEFNRNQETMRINRGMNESYRIDKITEINNLGNHIIQSREISKTTPHEIITSKEVNHWIQQAESIIKGFYSDSLTHFRSIYNAKKEDEVTYAKFEELRSCFRKAISPMSIN
jgi:hypothetical protein